MTASQQVDVLIIGAGAAGLMCAISAGQRGRKVLVVDHANKVGKKILMSGGGRCNFTNMYAEPDNFLCENPHFFKSALARYTQWDFIELVGKHQVPYHEKKLGQLFCDNKASDIVDMLLSECDQAGAQVRTHCSIESVAYDTGKTCYLVKTTLGDIAAESLVVATGGLSIPTMGATGLGYELAEQFGLRLLPRTAGLVPFTLSKEQLAPFASLVGSSADVRISCGEQSFRENILFTHRGLSGPAVLQISSYWQPGKDISIDWSPDRNLMDFFQQAREERPKAELKTVLANLHTKNWANVFCEHWLNSQPMNSYSDKQLQALADQLHGWTILPAGTEGYRTAEVTLGGVNTDDLSSKTLEAKNQPGLYFVGEVVDVTGWLGGFNFQWAWASGHAAGSFA
ncbi:NAD(P)/FAD-dependent oxidoreductase [Aestuariicella hydrocarbonica]|uniref:NAD(P)/FAD-dependent oxidoreductase n=1 Tax=Pseudomaricurvus hydrocarbonicus TaxID=1470433 RepID=A0A9E5JT76_9GAMM|nr:NAD(P)/FAD-dependent oxidoreductase [Aestuariicella hydrocarbonica]NHO64106.1 NAD(P)/FAD-dependent oxidoreductase [Aestuariicella hydrocarbonica]